MKSSSLFTYILYALLAALILLAGKMVLDKRADIRAQSDPVNVSPAPVTNTGKAGGIEEEEHQPINTSPSREVGSSNKSIDDQKKPEPPNGSISNSKPERPTAAPPKSINTATAKGVNTAPPPVQKLTPPSKGRYLVVVGTFTLRENALAEMENMINAGYSNAEVMKYKEDLWRVIALRCKTAEEAAQQEGDLERHGIDAIVVDGYKK
jgi:cell division protein FtsN